MQFAQDTHFSFQSIFIILCFHFLIWNNQKFIFVIKQSCIYYSIIHLYRDDYVHYIQFLIMETVILSYAYLF